MVPKARFWFFLEAAGCGFCFSHSLPFCGALGCALGHVINLDILLDPKEDIPHIGNFVLYQVLVERVGDLQLIDERCRRNVFIAVIYLSI